MIEKIMKKDKPKILLTACVFTVFAAMLAGGDIRSSQAETETTQTTTTTTTQVGNGGNFKTVQIEKTETTEQPEKKEEGHSSILGSFFGFVGNVIAFPFRLIGSAFKAIF